jgi:glycosyltransferase involved in cell wall biosynthesis
MSALRFCMLTTFYPPHNFGGDGIGIQRLSRALAQRGHDVTVVHEVDAFNSLSRGKAVPAPEDDGVEVIGLRSGLGVLSPLLTQQTGRPVVHRDRIRRIMRDGRFDVTMFHNISLVGGPGILSEGSGVRLYEAHEHWLVCPTHVLWRHNREACPERECLRCTLHHRRPPQLWRYTGYLEKQLEHVDAFIAKSEFSRDKHREFGFPRPMNVIPYFLPSGASPAGVAERPQERPYFLFVGRLEKIKGLDDVIPAFRDYPDAELLIAGDGEYGDTLRALGEGIPNVRFLGRIAPEELRALYAHAVALIVPSVCFETFGIILIEAFRQGTPVVARRLGPFPEIVDAAGGGELFETEQELVEALRRSLAGGTRRRQLGERGRNAFHRHWCERVVVPQYLDIVARAARKRGNEELAARAWATGADTE